jgi:hypothetical protein
VRGDLVVALVVAKSERPVRFHGIQSAVLQRVRAYLVAQADATAFLTQVEEKPARHAAQLAERELELVAAVAAQRSERVSREAFRMEPRRHVARAHDVAMDQRDVLLPIAIVPERDDPETAETGRQIGDRIHLDADVVRAETRAIVVLVPLDQIFQSSDTPQARAGRCRSHELILAISPVCAGETSRRVPMV